VRLRTPHGVAGVAVVGVEFHERDAVLAALRTPSGSPLAPRAGAAQRGVLRVADTDVDDVLVVTRRDGALELHLHGAPAVLAALRTRFAVEPEPPPDPAAALLRAALSAEQLDLALEQLALDFAAELAALAALPPGERAVARAAALARSRAALALATPQRVVLVGRQNAGKSSLFNALAGRERALVGATAGVTRDAIAEITTLAGYPYELVDTAGEGDAQAAIDTAAIARGRELHANAIVVLAIDASIGPHAIDRALAPRAALVLATKGDLSRRAAWPPDVPCAAATSTRGAAAATLRTQLGALLRAHRALPRAGPVGGFAALDGEQLAALQAAGD
jgi:tRNA modification GTPase